jgi:hypothetical protein
MAIPSHPGVKTPGYFQIVPSGRSDAPATFLRSKTGWTETEPQNNVKTMKPDSLQTQPPIGC